METTLYQYWRSSASWRVRWALAIKGVAFRKIAVNIVGGEQFSAEHRERNPMGHVPALVIDGRTLAESVAILEYLEETRPTPALYPRDPWLRARTRQIVEVVNSGIQPLQNLVVLARHSPEAPAQKEWAAYFNERGVRALEAVLTEVATETGDTGPFALGATFTAADVFVAPQVATARRFGVALERFPRVLALEKAAMATEHAASALPENQPDAPARS